MRTEEAGRSMGTNLCIQLFLLVLVLMSCSEGKKQKKKLVFQNCTTKADSPFRNASATDIYYSIVSNDTSASCMHFVWSMVGYPTLHLARTTDPKLCSCNAAKYDPSYPEDQNGTVTIPGLESDFSLTMVFTRLIEFNGTKHYYGAEGLNASIVCNRTAFASNTNYSDISLSNMSWTFSPENHTFVGSLLTNDTVYKNTTRFSIRTSIPAFMGNARLPYFPKTLFTENSTTFDIISENYPFNTTANGDYSRLSLELFLIHGKNVSNGSIAQVTIIDDEYTPSVFSTHTYNTSGRGYFQWKPISYQDSMRKSTSSQQASIVTTGSEKVCMVSEVPAGLASALYSTAMSKNISNVTRWFVAFGTSGDGTDTNPSYNTWTVVTGSGDVPKDTFSLVVIITIIVGAGIPVALVLLGAVYIFIRKKPWQNVQRWVNGRSGRGYSRLS